MYGDQQTAPAFTHESVRFSAGKTRSGELFKPNAGRPGSWPGIVLVHGNLGLNQTVRQSAGKLAADGYLVLAVNLYEVGNNPASEEEAAATWDALDRRDALSVCAGALGYLQTWTADTDNMGVVGWGEGGALALELGSTQSSLKAIVDYGGIPTLDAMTLKGMAGRYLIEHQKVPNEDQALHFLNLRLKHSGH